MTNAQSTPPAVGRRIVILAAVLGILAIFVSSMLYRWDNPSLKKTMRQPSASAPGAPGAQGGMSEGMAGMDMEGVRSMIEGLEQRLEENPEDLEALMQLANIRILRGDREGAAQYLDRAQQAAAADKMALMDLASRWFELDRYDKAAQTLEQILVNEPEEVFAHYNLGVLYKFRLDEPEKGERHLRRVAEGEHGFDDLRAQAKKALEED